MTIEVDGLCKTYRGGKVRALDGVSLQVKPGEIFGLIGPNGAGKTTLMSCLLGLVRPDQGAVRFDGRGPDDLEVRRTTGYLPERLAFDRFSTGRSFLGYQHALAGRTRRDRRAEVEAGLEQVGLPIDARGVALRKYSRGMLQRLGLAQALIGRPRFLLLDEPSSGVDPTGVLFFLDLLRGLKAKGVTVVFNSHQLDQMERVCDRVAFIQKGRIGAVETLARGAAEERSLAVRWLARGEPPDGALRALCSAAGATLLERSPGFAAFTVQGDEGAARLLAALHAAGLPLIEAARTERRLERFFTEHA